MNLSSINGNVSRDTTRNRASILYPKYEMGIGIGTVLISVIASAVNSTGENAYSFAEEGVKLRDVLVASFSPSATH